jgi:hypothetical protein
MGMDRGAIPVIRGFSLTFAAALWLTIEFHRKTAEKRGVVTLDG